MCTVLLNETLDNNVQKAIESLQLLISQRPSDSTGV